MGSVSRAQLRLGCFTDRTNKITRLVQIYYLIHIYVHRLNLKGVDSAELSHDGFVLIDADIMGCCEEDLILSKDHFNR